MNPISRLIELKRKETLLAADLKIATSEAIAYYKANPVLKDPKKPTGTFTSIDGEDLQAKVTWKLVKTSSKNPDHAVKAARLAEVEASLKTIHADKLAEVEARIKVLNELSASYLSNEETEKLKTELKDIPATLTGDPREELSVELPKQ